MILFLFQTRILIFQSWKLGSRGCAGFLFHLCCCPPPCGFYVKKTTNLSQYNQFFLLIFPSAFLCAPFQFQRKKKKDNTAPTPRADQNRTSRWGFNWGKVHRHIVVAMSTLPAVPLDGTGANFWVSKKFFIIYIFLQSNNGYCTGVSTDVCHLVGKRFFTLYGDCWIQSAHASGQLRPFLWNLLKPVFSPAPTIGLVDRERSIHTNW